MEFFGEKGFVFLFFIVVNSSIFFWLVEKLIFFFFVVKVNDLFKKEEVKIFSFLDLFFYFNY